MSADENNDALKRRTAELDNAIAETKRSAADARTKVDLRRSRANIKRNDNLEAAVALAANVAAIDGGCLVSSVMVQFKGDKRPRVTLAKCA
jgi:hypothetical protein